MLNHTDLALAVLGLLVAASLGLNFYLYLVLARLGEHTLETAKHLEHTNGVVIELMGLAHSHQTTLNNNELN